MKEFIIVLSIIVFALAAKSQNLPLSFPKSVVGWEKVKSSDGITRYNKMDGKNLLLYVKETNKESLCRINLGSLVLTSRTQWIQFWEAYQIVSSYGESLEIYNKMSGFKEGEFDNDINYTRCCIGDLYMKVVFTIKRDSYLEIFAFDINDQNVAISHILTRE